MGIKVFKYDFKKKEKTELFVSADFELYAMSFTTRMGNSFVINTSRGLLLADFE